MAKYGKKFKKTYKRYKKYKKSKTNTSPDKINMAIGKYVGPFPTSVVTKLRYCGYKRLDPAAGGGISTMMFRANGIYDPDVAVGGHQPLGRDQWADCYYHYTVLGSKCTVEFCGLNDSPNYVPHKAGVYLSGLDATGGSTWVTMAEQGHTSTTLVAGSAGLKPSRVVSRLNVRKFFDVKDPEDDDTLTAPVGGDPSDAAYFIVWAAAMDESTDTLGVRAAITIEYIVAWGEPKEIISS